MGQKDQNVEVSSKALFHRGVCQQKKIKTTSLSLSLFGKSEHFGLFFSAQRFSRSNFMKYMINDFSSGFLWAMWRKRDRGNVWVSLCKECADAPVDTQEVLFLHLLFDSSANRPEQHMNSDHHGMFIHGFF